MARKRVGYTEVKRILLRKVELFSQGEFNKLTEYLETKGISNKNLKAKIMSVHPGQYLKDWKSEEDSRGTYINIYNNGGFNINFQVDKDSSFYQEALAFQKTQEELILRTAIQDRVQKAKDFVDNKILAYLNGEDIDQKGLKSKLRPLAFGEILRRNKK